MKASVSVLLVSFSAIMLFVGIPVSATWYTFNIWEDEYSYNRYWWEYGGNRAVDLWVDVDYLDWGWVDVYFLNEYDFNVYTSGSGTIYPIFKQEYLNVGPNHMQFNFNPVAYAYYYLVIDNTDIWGGSANYHTYGSWEMTSDWVYYLLYGYVYQSGTSVGVPYATVSLLHITGTELTTTTNSQGYYTLSVSEGIYGAEISASGYLSTSTEVTISGDQQRNFYLVRSGPPSEPQNLQAIAGDNKVTLTWSAPSDTGGHAIMSYKVYRGTNPGGETLLTTIGNVLTYIDTTAMNGITYFYQVSAVNSFYYEGSRCAECSATPFVPEFEPMIAMSAFMLVTMLVALISRYKEKR